jgi:hypothetical protein
MGEWGVKADKGVGRRQMEAGMEQRRELEQSQEHGDWKRVRRGWCFGPKEFREELLELIGEKQGQHHYGEELKESDEQKAERLITETLKKLKWTAQTLVSRRKGDPIKGRLAARLRKETAVTWPWIAQRLSMGHWRTARNAVRNLK